MSDQEQMERTGLEVAVVGMAGRFPGAQDVEELWRNLLAGVESVVDLSREEVVARGADPRLVDDPHYVRAAAEVLGAELFDAAFWDVPPREAELIDPQHRLFLDTCSEALEDAGIDPFRDRRPIGVFGGSSVPTYAIKNVLASGADLGALTGLLGFDKDHLTTLVSWKLDLTGPSLAVQTACSTSLVAIHLAAQSLLNGECDVALAGGSSILFPQSAGYLWHEGGILSRDGRCRSFDAQGSGTIFGSGAAVVVLKRLDDALADGDRIVAVLKGSAVSNDGAGRVGYAAPGVAGQARALRAAQLFAEVAPETIGFVEAHGTATELGDPIEFSALKEAFAEVGAGRVLLGAIKSNIGHLNAASGVAGFIKAALAVERGEVPATLHFERPNPRLGLAGSPFVVNAETVAFPATDGPRRAAVSAYGMGGTNAHAILEEPPAPAPSGPTRERQVVVVSAKTESALKAAASGLGRSLAERADDLALGDVAWTAALGRREFRHRLAVTAGSLGEAAERLLAGSGEGVVAAVAAERPVHFLFPGQGSQYAGMAAGLYATEPTFRAAIDRAAEILRPELGRDLRDLLSAPEDAATRTAADRELEQTVWAQPALFAVELALAELWRSLGVEPAGMIGHSLGELVAACLAGVFTEADALRLVALRGRLMQALPAGAMLAVPIAEGDLAPHLTAALSIAAVNAPGVSVVSGPADEIERFRLAIAPLVPAGLEVRALHTSHAFHSAMMDPIVEPFERAVAAVERRAPVRSWISNATGREITADEATDPAYWARHLRGTVRFADGLAALAAAGPAIYLEVGPGNALGGHARRHAALAGAPVLASLRHPKEEIDDAERFARAVAELWTRGAALDWRAFFAGEQRRKVQLPSYPFERRRYFVDAPARGAVAERITSAALAAGAGAPDVAGAAVAPAPMPVRAVAHPRPALATPYAPPSDETERRIAAIWADLFGFDQVGVHDDFFELGGHSLLATRVLGRLEDAFGPGLDLEAVFRFPTVAGLARALAALGRSAPEPPPPIATAPVPTGELVRAVLSPAGEPLLRALPRSGPLPLSFAQSRLWLLDRLAPGNPFYNLGGAVRIAGPLESGRFARAIGAVVRRQESLRTRFSEIAGEPVQFVATAAPVALRRLDLSGLEAERGQAEARRLAALQFGLPFDLSRAPLLRVWLARFGDADHALLYAIHHIVSDGWSLGILLGEIAAAYGAEIGLARPLPPLAIQYADFAVWQRAWFERGELDRQLAYWRRQLADPPATELPTDRPRPPRPSHRGGRYRLELESGVRSTVARFALERQASPFMVLLSVFEVLVARTAALEDLAIGTPIANRRRSEIEGLIGFFVNTLVLRTELAGDPTFETVLERTRATALGAFAHQDLPFERLVEELAPRRDAARNPFFQLMFNLLNTPEGSDATGLFEMTPLGASATTALFDLQVYLAEVAVRDTYQLTYEYASELFEEASVARLARGFVALLAGAIERPAARLSELPLLDAAEIAAVLAAGVGGAQAPFVAVHDAIAARALAEPGRIAVVAGDSSLTYGELAERANRLARQLRKRLGASATGAALEAKIGIAVERTLALPVGALGVLAAGASYVPLDPSYPVERLTYMAADAGLSAVIVSSDSADRERLAALAPIAIDLDAVGELSGLAPRERRPSGKPLEIAVEPAHLAYTIYTSGSTGRPKGVELPHGALANFLTAMLAEPGLSAADVLVSVTSLSFDIAGLELYGPLLVGARTVIAAREEVADGRRLGELLERSGATVMQATPSGWRLLLDAGWSGRSELRALVGGEALPPALAAELLGKVGALFNMYGPTETAVWSTLDRVGLPASDSEPSQPGPITIGRPIAATRVAVVDPWGNPMPAGVPGELWIGGAGVARGYHARPELTAERFLPDPYAAEAGARLYRTGDLARLLPDGRYECLGRIDHQVKVRGHRIELGEIEAALSAHPDVAAAVVAVRGEGDDRRLVGYLVPRLAGTAVDPREAVSTWLRTRLPEPMIPSAFVRLEALPLLPNGKVDRKALPAPEGEVGAATPPSSATEIALARIWEELLGVSGVGLESRFFELGGHSLLATRMLARVRETLGVDLPLGRVFESPELFRLAAAIDRERGALPGVPAPVSVAVRTPAPAPAAAPAPLPTVPIAPVAAPSAEPSIAADEPVLVARPHAGPQPLSFAQSRLWLLDRLAPGNPFYNLGGALRLTGPLVHERFVAATAMTVRRQESLRTRFTEVGGAPAQVVEADADVPVRALDLSGLPRTRADVEVLRLARVQLGLPFDLSRVPLVRAWLARLGADEHVLLYAIHHIVSDGWSTGVLITEVATAYEVLTARERGIPASMPAPPSVQYVDFTLWQRAWFEAGELDRQLGYWRGRLAGAPITELPSDRPRPPVASYRGGRDLFVLPAGLAPRVATLARSRRASPFMVLLAAFQTLVSRLAVQDDVVVGTPVANRRRREVEGLIGFFVNTLVLRTDLAGDPSFETALERTRATALGAFAHQDLPFERLVEELAPRRDLGRNPLFQLMFNLLNMPGGGGGEGSTLKLEPLGVTGEASVFDLQIYVTEKGDSYDLLFEFARDLFEAVTISRLARAYGAVLGAAIERPAARLSELPLLNAEETAAVLATGVGVEQAPFVAVHQGIAAHALAEPGRIAVVAGDSSLTYGELAERANRLARQLRKRLGASATGAALEAKVGIAVERTLALPVGALGVLTAGASYVPLDPSYPAERLTYMAADAGLSAVIVSSDSADRERLAALAPIPIELDAAGELCGLAPRERRPSGKPLEIAVEPAHLAYTIYTSGSTGRPKGVELPHGALANFLTAMLAEPGLSAADVLVSVTSLSFDIAGLELYGPLLAGARTVIAAREEVADGRRLGELLERSGATVMQATPSGWRLLLDAGWSGRSELRALVGGEALPPALAAELLGKVGALFNMYGPTETAVWSTLDRVALDPSDSDPSRPGPITIGRPIAATATYVVDAGGELLPPGFVGELWIGGAGVARGYHARPELTAERFLPDPYAAEAGARLYRTGDLARRRADGRLDCLGRIDHQVKVRGHRIELGEIEAALSAHPDVAAAAATVHGDGADKRIVGYVVARPETALAAVVEASRDRLRETLAPWLRERLPEPMLPSAYVALDALPLTPNGKVDRKALPAPEAAPIAPSQPPRTDTERALARIWEQLLGVAGIGVDSAFFDLGGHSLLATRMLAQIRDEFGVDLPLRSVFEAPELGRLAAAIDGEVMAAILAGTHGSSAIPPLAPAAREAGEGGEVLAPTSFAQERLWFLEQLERGTSAYNVSSTVRLDGRLDVGAMRATLDEIVRRHEMLRTRFVTRDGLPLQAIAPQPAARGSEQPPMPFPWEEVDLSMLPPGEREAAAEARAAAAMHQPFDLATAPLARALLVRLDERSHRLTVAMHHLATDGWSNGVLLAEIAALYPAFLGGEKPTLPPLPIQYADYAIWQRGWLKGDLLDEQIAFWRASLAGAPALLELPLDHPRPAIQTFHGGRAPFPIQAPLAEALRALARRSGASVFMTVLAAFQALLGRLANVDDLVIGTPVAGRSRRELEGVVGFFVNTLALRADLSGDPTFAELIARARAATLAGHLHQDVPFERVVQAVEPERSRAHSPIFQVHLVFDEAPAAGGTALPELTVTPGGQHLEISKFDLTLVVADGGAGRPMAAQLRYNVELFEPATVARFAERFVALLESVARAPETRLSAIDLLAATERPALIAAGTGERTEGAEIALAPALIQARAAARPEALAVLFEQERTTYGELDARSNRLARHLRSMGVGPEVLVGIYLERSPRLIETLLAVWKAGGAYLPLDPSLPQERLSFMIQDASVALLITEESLLDALPDHHAWVIDLDAAAPMIEMESADDPGVIPALAGGSAPGAAATFDPRHLAYVIYTSGSTGRPKGVAVTHRGLANLIREQGRVFQVQADLQGGVEAGATGEPPRLLQFASIGFDASVSEIAVALGSGATLVMAAKASILPGFELYTLLRDSSIANVTLPPSALAALPADKPLPALKTLVVAGEACPGDLAESWGASRALINAYGPTENTVCVTMATYAPGSGRLPLGRPIANVEAYVLDRAGDLAPSGTPGELAVGGVGLARGYLGAPDLTAARFVPHPFSARPGERLYRTGDLARWHRGELEFLGRIDHQVKVRGFRIELGEIEAALASHPHVREAVVVVLGGREDGADRRLVAYVAPRAEFESTLETVLEPAELRAYVGRSLPEYMVPSVVAVLPELPKNASGKVDRRALPDPQAVGAALREVKKPRNAVETFLAGLFAEILQVDEVGIDENFFDLGGNSIAGALLVNRLQEELGEIVHVVVMFEAPTVEQLAAFLAAEYQAALARRFGVEVAGAGGDAARGPIDEAAIARFRALVPERRAPRLAGAKNPPAVFVLSPPRSGSTLFRVMLAGHPGLFAPPELELLPYDDLRERRDDFPGRYNHFLEGAVRAAMELLGSTAEAAEAELDRWETEGLSMAEVFGRLQALAAPRLLVDKTPGYSLHRSILERAEGMFEGAKYIHLIRHPYGMIRSFEEAKLDQVFFRAEHDFSRRELAELVWLESHRNILAFFETLPAARKHAVVFEELVAEPERVLLGVCEFLGLPYEPAMAAPYAKSERQSARMTDGLHSFSRMVGDVKFHEHGRVDATVADRWKSELVADDLGAPSWAMAERLGFSHADLQLGAERAPGLEPIAREAWREGEPLPLSFAQERVWFLHRFAPESPAYNIPSAIRLRGDLSVPALRFALDGLVERHAALRTSFAVAAGQPVQIVHAPSAVALPAVDLAALAPARGAVELERLARVEAIKPFDLDRPPLLRATLVRVEARDHAVLFATHHIASDGWSSGILINEVSALYARALAPDAPELARPLADLPIQYADYSIWQRRVFDDVTLARELAWWHQALAAAGPPPALELPTDRPRPPVQTTRGRMLGRPIPSARFAGFARLGQEEGATPFILFVAAFGALLSRLTGQVSFALGTPIANRQRREVEGLIGFFMNTLALRVDLAGDPSFREQVRRSKKVVLGAFAHQDVPFEKVVEEIHPSRDMSRSPLFQAMLLVQNAPGGTLELPGLALEPVAFERATAKLDLSLYLNDTEAGLHGGWEWNLDLFDEATIERFASAFDELLGAASAAPEARLSDLPLLSAGARAEILAAGSGRPVAAAPALVHEAFARQAARAPERIACVAAGEEVAYGELLDRVNRLARHFRGLGLGPEAKVGIAVERTLALPVATLGVLTAGASYVPLDPAYPAERLALMAEDAGLSALVLSGAAAEPLAALASRLVRLSPAGELVDGGADAPRHAAPAVDAASLAYTIYTSGSTGRPKGVELPHGALANFIQSMIEEPGVGADDVLVAVTSLSFDIAGLELYAPLAVGARVVIATREEVADGRLLGGLLATSGATLLQATPSGYRVLLAAGWSGQPGLKALIGGEALPPALAGELQGKVGALFNMYGPTETAVWSTLDRVALTPSERGAITIGRPIAATVTYVVDASFDVQPVGVLGELLIGGAGVARGYHARPDLTAERFVPDPYASAPGARLYRTGDVARLLPDGRLECLGRLDHQVKVRGHRIELGEIEAVLSGHPDVAAAAATVWGEAEEKRIAAYFVARPGSALAADRDARETLAAWLRGRLPEPMLPSAYVALDALPLTPNGKVDRKALPLPERTAVRAATPPGTPTERTLAAIWQDLLGAGEVGIESNFFELGGHSLLATRLVAAVRERLAVELPLRSVFEAPTLGAFAARIDERLDRTGPGATLAELPPLTAAPRGADGGIEAPLSFAQERLYFLQQLDPASAAYNIPAALRLRGPLAVPAFAAALRAVVARHESLRTAFVARAGAPVQVVGPDVALPVPVVDLGALGSQVVRERELRRTVGRELLRPFTLAAPPLLRATIVALAADEHAVLFAMHHIVSDLHSMRLLVDEVAALYAAALERRASPLPPLPLQVADVALWQRQNLSAEVIAAELAAWKSALAGVPPIELPTDRPRPPVQRGHGSSRGLLIAGPEIAALEALAVEQGVSPFMLYLTAFAALLSRTSGQDDFAIGTTIDQRDQAAVRSLIGYFINVLALRMDLSGRPSFRELLLRTRGVALAAYEHKNAPFERVVDELGIERDLSRTSIFQVLFHHERATVGGGELPGIALERIGLAESIAKGDLALTLTEAGGAIGAGFEFDLDLFDPATVLRLGLRFGNLLRAVAAAPDRPLAELDVASPGERHQALVEWTDTAAPYGLDVTLHGLFEAQVERTPNALAVAAEQGELSYAELDARANRLAHRLAALGVRRGARVAIAVERSLDLMVAILGTLKAGAAYVPLDPSYPAERLAFLFADSGVAAAIAQERVLPSLPPISVPLVRIDAEPLEDEPAARPAAGATGADLAYVIYTSGSTGRPKGVLIPHRAIGNRIQWQLFAHPFAAGERLLQKTPTSFDASVWELFAPLAAGAAVVFAEPDAHRDAAAMVRAIAAAGVGTLQLVPSMLQVFVEEPDLASCTHLRRLFAGGEALPTALARRAAERLAIPVHNLYGPTEAAIDVASRPRVVEVRGRAISPIGRPLPNVRLHLLDREQRPVPLGVAGELAIGGVNLSWGYHGRPDLTAEKFVPDGVLAHAGRTDVAGYGPGARLYRTGDLARFLPSGEIEYLGRIDQQIKIRGFRVELGEIESQLRALPAIAQAAVVARDGEGGDRRLVAYVVAAQGSDGAELAPRALRDALGKVLPDHMVPADVVALEALPTLPNGKLDLAALPAPDEAAPGAITALVAPRTPVEEVLASIMAEVLGLPEVSVTDSFFDLGGHSLLALQVTSRARAAFGVPVKVRMLFESPSVEKLARTIAASRAAAAEPLPALEPIARTARLPLSFAQERLWFLDRLRPGTAVYNLPAFLRLEGDLDVDALASALAAVVARHEALRTTFVDDGGQPVQRIAPPEQAAAIAALRRIDLAALPRARREGEAERIAPLEARRGFDLETGPLVHVTLLRMAAADHIGLFVLHHIVSDEWSNGIFVRELGALYRAAQSGEAAPLDSLPPLPIQYADFAAWQRAWLDGPALDRRMAFWRTTLDGAPLAIDLPTDRPRPPAQTFRGANFQIRLAPEIEAAVRAFARGANASPFMTLFAAYSTLVGRLAGVEDLLVGSPIAGRTRPEVEGLIGFFVNTLVLRARPRAELAFSGLVGEVRGTLLDTYAEQDMPFERLVGELNPERDPSRPPLASVTFSFQNTAVGTLDLGGVALKPVRSGGTGTAKADLSLYLWDQGRGMGGVFEYSTDLFDGATIARIARQLETLLAAALAEPSLAVGDLPLLEPAERAEIASAWSRAVEAPAPARTLGALFEETAALYPELPAAASGGSEISYRDLNARANQLAHHLRAFGVGPEVVVGVCTEASIETAVAVLGIAKAGGAFLPLDPAMPLERFAYVLEDAGIAILLTQERLQEALPALPVFAITLDGAGWDLAATQSEADLEPLADVDNLAYVIYTSGSTGRPKGVGVTHRGLANLGRELGRRGLGIEPGGRLLQFASLAFDASVADMAEAWGNGAALVFAPRERRMPGADLAALLVDERITVATLPPSALAAMPELPGGVLPTIAVAGEACPRELAERWSAGRRFVDAYGPTETTVCATLDVYGGGAVTIGRALAGFATYVVDRRGALGPEGVPGELWLGGVGLARGYRGRPDLTAERFVPDPFGAEPGARLYRTGDLVRFVRTEAGGLPKLDFLGRIDHQVKVRGFRIELGEIEAVLGALPLIREAVVIAREEPTGDLCLVAFAVPRDADGAARPTSTELRVALAEKLPDYMVPGVVAVVDDLPRTQSGKVDRAALVGLEDSARRTERPYVAPRTDVEWVLAGIWQEVLAREPIGVDEDFFDLGGHSLLATRAVSRIQKVFRSDLELRDFFAATTIEKLAATLLASEKQAGVTERTAKLLREIQRLSPEAREAMLAGVPGDGGGGEG